MNKIDNITTFIIKIAISVSLFAFLAFSIAGEYKRSQLNALNHYMPKSYNDLLYAQGAGNIADFKKLDPYLFYYKIAAKYMPGCAEVHDMLGFCHYYRGAKQKAIDSYKKAIELRADFFWSHYNLGLIYFKKRQYKKAIESFKNALESDPTTTMKYVYSSKIYRDIISYIKVDNKIELIKTSLSKAYHNAQILGAFSAAYIKNPQADVNIPDQIKKINPQIF